MWLSSFQPGEPWFWHDSYKNSLNNHTDWPTSFSDCQIVSSEIFPPFRAIWMTCKTLKEKTSWKDFRCQIAETECSPVPEDLTCDLLWPHRLRVSGTEGHTVKVKYTAVTVQKNPAVRLIVLTARTAEQQHRDKDMTSSDIWILRHQPVSWFAADHKGGDRSN